MYALLHYRGDRTELAKGLTVTRSDGGAERTVPVLLGADVVDHPYEVLDVEYDADGDRSTVHLGPASADTIRGNRSAAYQQREQHADELIGHARARHFWRPDVWAPAPPRGVDHDTPVRHRLGGAA